MKLIEKKIYPNGKNPRTNTVTYGIFECPVCEAHVERALSKGNRTKTCGNKVCRAVAFTTNKSVAEANSPLVTSMPHYDTLRIKYKRMLVGGVLFSAELNTLEKFVKVVHSDYAAAIKGNASVVVYTTEDVMTASNYRLTHNKDMELYYNTSITAESVAGIAVEIDKTISEVLLVKSTLKAKYIATESLVGLSGSKLSNGIFTTDDYIRVKEFLLGSSTSHTEDGVYLVKSGAYTKIGVAKDINKRLLAMQTGNPVALQLVYYTKVQDAYNVETYLHGSYVDRHVNGEWFDLNPDDVAEIVATLSSTKLPAYVADYMTKVEEDRLEYAAYAREEKVVVKEECNTVVNYTPVTRDYSHTVKHGLYSTELYKYWNGAVRSKRITLCEEWKDAVKFTEDLQEDYVKGMVLAPMEDGLPIGPDNYRWITMSNVVSKTNSSRSRAVVQLNKQTGEVIAEYNSQKEAGEVTGLHATKIGDVCNGKRNSTGGYRWVYKDS